jgi:hypothetical protein
MGLRAAKFHEKLSGPCARLRFEGLGWFFDPVKGLRLTEA